MNRRYKSIVATVFLAAMLFLTSCTTMQITMSPEAPIHELKGKHIPVKVALYMDDLQNYHWHGTSGAEMSKLDYDLGSASKSLFLESFMEVSESVELVHSKPPYSEQEKGDIAIIVQPNITGFSEDHSAFLRVTNYHAEITYHVIVYDRDGEVILDDYYSEKGDVRGKATHSPGNNYAEPAEQAMSRAIVRIIDDIATLNLGDKEP